MPYTGADQDELIRTWVEGGAGAPGLIAVANHVERKTLERAANADTSTGVLVELTHQVGRIANALNSAPERQTFDVDKVREVWAGLDMRMYDDKAIALLEALGFTVESREHTRRI